MVAGMATSCNLDNDPIECPEEYTGSLADSEAKLVGRWELTAIGSDIDIDLTNDNVANAKKDLFDQYTACDRDATYEFDADRSYDFNYGQRATNCEQKGKSSGTWKLTADVLSLVVNCNTLNDKITFNAEGTAYSFTNDMNVRDVNGSIKMAKITFTYSKVGSN